MSCVVRAEALAARHCGGRSCELLKNIAKACSGCEFLDLLRSRMPKREHCKEGIARTVKHTVPIFVAQDALEPLSICNKECQKKHGKRHRDSCTFVFVLS